MTTMVDRGRKRMDLSQAINMLYKANFSISFIFVVQHITGKQTLEYNFHDAIKKQLIMLFIIS